MTAKIITNNMTLKRKKLFAPISSSTYSYYQQDNVKYNKE
jgi:hypothetical protein